MSLFTNIFWKKGRASIKSIEVVLKVAFPFKTNPVVQNILVCQFSGRVTPSIKWKSDQKGVLNFEEKTLYIEADSRLDGYAEIIT